MIAKQQLEKKLTLFLSSKGKGGGGYKSILFYGLPKMDNFEEQVPRKTSQKHRYNNNKYFLADKGLTRLTLPSNVLSKARFKIIHVTFSLNFIFSYCRVRRSLRLDDRLRSVSRRQFYPQNKQRRLRPGI